MAKLGADAVTSRVNGATLVEESSLELNPGELVAIIGPNGAGKSSLVKALVGINPISGGTVHLAGQAISDISPLQRARHLSYLPQQRPLAWPLEVRDVVALGRFAFGTAPGRLSSDDQKAVTNAIETVGITHLADRHSDTLSGGEQALMHIARALAAETPLLIADEPLAALDPAHQWQVMGILKRYVAAGNGALVVLHDIALAAQFADRLVWMADGTIIAKGSPGETLTTQRLAEVYGVSATISNGLPLITGFI